MPEVEGIIISRLLTEGRLSDQWLQAIIIIKIIYDKVKDCITTYKQVPNSICNNGIFWLVVLLY